MKKYSFWVFYKEYDAFLESLREIGVVHIQEIGKTESEILNKQLKQLQRYTLATNGLENIETEITAEAVDAETAVSQYEKAVQKLDSTKAEIQKTEKEINQVDIWGDFDSEKIAKLEEEGIFMHFYSSSEYNEEALKDFQQFKIVEDDTKTYFVVVTDSNEKPEIDADTAILPANSATDLCEKLADLQKRTEAANTELQKLVASVSNIKNAIVKINNDIALTQAQLNTQGIAENKAMLLEGYAPNETEVVLESYLNENGIFYTADNAVAEDDVPILLKNNKFNRLFEVISDLYAKPNYNEFDLTPYFSIFYLIFFGFCLGDAGYGLLFMTILFVVKRKVGESAKGYVTLAQLLSLSTIIFGIAGGTFFGIGLYETNLPVYRNLAESMSHMEGDFVSNPLQDIMLKASLGLGITQILLGIIINGVLLTKQKGIMWGLSKFGWAGLFIASGVNAFMTMESGAEFLNIPYYIVAGICLFAIFFLNTPGANPIANFASGLWDAYNTLVGGLGDLLSYMRLFALGLASSILGLVFNDLSSTVLSDGNIIMQGITIIAMLLILLVGHGINIFMSTLSATVHPLRLVFVEFYKNAGFQGGGKGYNPFRKIIN